jgi:hypothetical protein
MYDMMEIRSESVFSLCDRCTGVMLRSRQFQRYIGNQSGDFLVPFVNAGGSNLCNAHRASLFVTVWTLCMILFGSIYVVSVRVEPVVTGGVERDFRQAAGNRRKPTILHMIRLVLIRMKDECS